MDEDGDDDVEVVLASNVEEGSDKEIKQQDGPEEKHCHFHAGVE